MIPQWLVLLSYGSLALGFLSSAWIIIALKRKPAHMAIMNLVWPLCALFGHVLVLWFFFRHGRGDKGEQVSLPVSVAKGALHCGAGCSLGDIIAESSATLFPVLLSYFGLGWLFSERIYAAWAYDFAWAFGLGIVFQYFSIVPMRHLSFFEGLKAAVKADTLSLTSWQIGMYGMMGLAHFWIFPQFFSTSINPTMPAFWFVMQIAMIAGFITAYPVNWWLITKGIKERM